MLRIAAALRVEVGELLAAPEEPGPGTVVRGEASPFYEGEGFRFQPLIPEAGPEGLAAVKIVFPADRTEPEYKEHEGEEWIYVLSGRLRLTLGGESTVLEPNMVFAVEAEVGRQGAGTGAFEHNVLITPDGPEILTTSVKNVWWE